MAYYQHPHDVTQLPAWQALRQHREQMNDFSMREAFASDPQRFDRFSLSSCGLLLDYSKNLISEETVALLVKLAEEARLDDAIQAMFNGATINASARKDVRKRPRKMSEVLSFGCSASGCLSNERYAIACFSRCGAASMKPLLDALACTTEWLPTGKKPKYLPLTAMSGLLDCSTIPKPIAGSRPQPAVVGKKPQ